MGLAAFNRMRRMLAEKEANELAENQEHGEEEADGKGNDDQQKHYELPDYENLTIEELQDFAETNAIDLGNATTHKGILKKIIEASKE